MLTQSEMAEIDRVITDVPRRKNGAADALSIVQRYRGWISDEALADIAAYLGMDSAELDEVATFYNRIYRCPVGKHILLVCDSVSCWIRGSVSLIDHLLKTLGIKSLCETTADGMFTVLPAACLGACDHAPAMMVDGEMFGDLTVQKIDEILHRYRNAPIDGTKNITQSPSNLA